MASIDGSYTRNISESQLLKTGQGLVHGFIVASHTSGTLRLVDGLYAGIPAFGTLTSDATNVTDGDTVTIDTITYRFKDTLAQAYDVKIGASAAATLDNLKLAINASGLAGTDYYAGTEQHPTVVAITNTDTTQVVAAKFSGTQGNSIVTTEASTHLSWGAATLASGTGTIGRYLMNTYTFAAGSQVVTFPAPLFFTTGLLAVIGGTSVNMHVIYN